MGLGLSDGRAAASAPPSATPSRRPSESLQSWSSIGISDAPSTRSSMREQVKSPKAGILKKPDGEEAKPPKRGPSQLSLNPSDDFRRVPSTVSISSDPEALLPLAMQDH